jgi:hypothetical protein
MSWLYSQVLVEEYLEANSLDGEQSAPSSGNLIPQAYCAPDKMKAHSRLSRFGMTFKPLTDDRGEELLMLFLEDFRAKTLAPQEKEQESKEVAAECGGTWRGLLVKWDQDMFSSKTVLCSEQEDSTLFSKTLPKWGMMLDGECWEQLTPVRLTKETECGLEPNGETFFHTPNTGGLDGGSNSRRALKKRMKSLWPTPNASDADKWSHQSLAERQAKGQQVRLNTAVAPEGGRGGSLNPTWVEWLMGWPLGWTDLKPLETDKSQRWPHSHGMS